MKRGIWHHVICPECGNGFEVRDCHVKKSRGKYCSRHCGNKSTSRTHGHTTKTGQSRTYISWSMMRQRCENPKSQQYCDYGAVGIAVCAEWSNFNAFLADMGIRPNGKTLDRIDGTKGYFPENCRWATPRQQCQNLRTNVFYEFEGDQLIMPQIARRLKINISTLRYRVRKNWPQEKWGDATRS